MEAETRADEQYLCAYYGSRDPQGQIVPASKAREWMTGPGSFANRCLPMVIANQAGWMLLNPAPFTATWDGGNHRESVIIEFEGGVTPPDAPVSSHFGLGIVTWSVPFLFRTPRGYNLLVRGPSNMPKDAIAPLEGVVETDWSVSTFTMNWKFTRPDTPVSFETGEPYCMVVPQSRHELEAFRPVLRHIATDPELHEATQRWARARQDQQVRKFLAEYTGDAVTRDSWEKTYYKGRTPSGDAVREHQQGLHLLGFEFS